MSQLLPVDGARLTWVTVSAFFGHTVLSDDVVFERLATAFVLT